MNTIALAVMVLGVLILARLTYTFILGLIGSRKGYKFTAAIGWTPPPAPKPPKTPVTDAAEAAPASVTGAPGRQQA